LYRGINEFKKGCQPEVNLVKFENSDVLNVFPQYFEQTEGLLLLGIECIWR